MEKKELLERVYDEIDNLLESEKIEVWNKYAEDTGETSIYPNRQEFFREHFSGFDVLRSIYNNYSADDWYVGYNEFDHDLTGSFTRLNDFNSPYDKNNLAEWLCDNLDAIGIVAVEENDE